MALFETHQGKETNELSRVQINCKITVKAAQLENNSPIKTKFESVSVLGGDGVKSVSFILRANSIVLNMNHHVALRCSKM
ncbi:hypothetical protein A0123_02789 [Gluconobacter cerinus]|uniref:Uncharacterized protein n=1 Tax=Gluconobacter cerinus TaxID=38307 RepID=A0A1B6VHH6_9PROT|nr:hypothetical protein A0123_02789 [Gluconobacter cerinus]